MFIEPQSVKLGLPRWCSGRKSSCQCRRRERCEFGPWVRKTPWSEEMASHASILPCQYTYMENPMGRGAWCATVHGISKSRI